MPPSLSRRSLGPALESRGAALAGSECVAARRGTGRVFCRLPLLSCVGCHAGRLPLPEVARWSDAAPGRNGIPSGTGGPPSRSLGAFVGRGSGGDFPELSQAGPPTSSGAQQSAHFTLRRISALPPRSYRWVAWTSAPSRGQQLCSTSFLVSL